MKEGLIQKKVYRFEQLKIRDFSGTITEFEEKEYDELEKWLKLHNKKVS